MTQLSMTSSGGTIYSIPAGVFSRKRPLFIGIPKGFNLVRPGALIYWVGGLDVLFSFLCE